MASYYIVDDNVTIISHLIHLFKNVYRFTCSLKITCGQSWDTPVIPTLKKAEAGLSGIQSQPGLCGTLSQLSSSKTKEREKRENKYEKILCTLYLVPLNDAGFQSHDITLQSE